MEKNQLDMHKLRYGMVYWYKSWLYRKAWCMLLCFVLIMTCTAVIIIVCATSKPHIELEFGTPEFLVNNDQCKIPNVLPWNSEFKLFYKPKMPYKCSDKELLTSIVYEEGQAFLYVNKSVVTSYSWNGVECCYQTVKRGTGDDADTVIKYSICHPFQERQLMNVTEVVVKCAIKDTQKIVYANAHPIILKYPVIKEKIAALQHKEKPPSVLLIGIDSVSRLNFHRMLPLTKEYFDITGWIEYKGYNKVGENTFPNLMALLTGKNITRSFEICKPYETGSFDHCNFIWKNYSNSNYVTAYIEDAIDISTFTYLKKGFLHPPTDFYYKPYLTAAEQLGTTLVDDMKFCSGHVSSGERILEVAKDFVMQMGDQPKFGLFWSNTFSHDDVNTPARMDQILADFFKDTQKYLTNTIVLIFSDHGMRFGDIRQTKTGWYEERLPFAYFWFPHSFRKRFPFEYNNIVGNSMKLTTPYDIYMTLQHVLELNDKNHARSYCDATKNCKSLFEDVGDRSCEDLGIPIHYCTCFGYKPFNVKSSIVQLAGEFAVTELNNILKEDVNTSLNCAQYVLDTVTLAQTAIYKNHSYILFQFKTVPEAMFEFTVSFNIHLKDVLFKREDLISRLDKYEATSQCIAEKKLYCYCRSNVEMKLNFFSFWFEV